MWYTNNCDDNCCRSHIAFISVSPRLSVLAPVDLCVKLYGVHQFFFFFFFLWQSHALLRVWKGTIRYGGTDNVLTEVLTFI